MKQAIFILLLLAAPSLKAQVLHLNSAIERTLDCSLTRKMAALEVEVKNAEQWQDNLYPNPALTVELDSFGGHHHGFDESEVSVSVAQLFLLGGKRCARYQLDGALTEIARWDYEIATQNLLQTLLHKYVEAYVAQEKRAVAEQQLRVAQETHTCAAEKMQAGKATILQEKRAALAVHSCKIKLDKAESALVAAKEELCALWEQELCDWERLEFAFYQLPAPPALANLEEALHDNPELAKANAAVEAGLAASDFEETMRIPDVEVEAGIGTSRHFRDQDFFVSLTVPLPIFNRNQGNRARASFQSWQAAYARENQEVQLRKNLRTSYHAWVNAYEAGKAFLEMEQLIAAETLKTTEESYRQGKIERQEWLDTKKTWLETKEQTIDALAEVHLKQVDTLRLTAQLPIKG